MPGFIKKQLLKYKHIMYSPEPKKFGTDAQSPLPTDETCKLTDPEIKQVQKIVGSILYYTRAVDLTVLMALSTIVSKQTKGTEKEHWKRLTKYLIIWERGEMCVCTHISLCMHTHISH
jgi:hypothetical protein